MSYSNLHLEDFEIPANVESLTKKNDEWSVKIIDGIYLFVWDTTKGPNHYTQQVNDTVKAYKYAITMNSDSAKLASLAKRLVKEQKSEKRHGLVLANTIADKLAPISDGNGYDFYTLITGEWIFLWLCSGGKENFAQFCSDISSVMRELTKGDLLKSATKLFNGLLNDQSAKNIKSTAKKLMQNAGELQHFEGTFEYLNQLTATVTDMLPLLVALGVLHGNNNALAEYAQAKNLAEQIAANGTIKEKLFYSIQKTFEEYYSESIEAYATKEQMEDIVIRIGGTLAAYGYSIYPNSIVAIIRLFENDVEDGLAWEEYPKNEKYDASDYPYSDSDEISGKYDDLWKNIDAVKLLDRFKS